MKKKDGFVVGKHYSLSDIWNIIKVPEEERTDRWLNTIYDFSGAHYMLCQAYNRSQGIFAQCRCHLGELYCHGKRGLSLQPGITRSIVYKEKEVHLFFERSEKDGCVYLGTGRLGGLDDGLTSPIFIRWEINSGDNLLPLRQHIDALRKFCAFGMSYKAWCKGWIPDKGGENLSLLELLLDQLAISSAIEEVEVDTARFGDGVNWDSGILEYEAHRSDLLSSIMATLLSFTYSWMALETLLGLLPLPKVPKQLKRGAKLIDEGIYYLKLALPSKYNEALLPGYGETLERFKKVVLSMPRYSKYVTRFDLQSHMNAWGIGIDKVRNVRNKFIHGVLQMPGPAEYAGEETEDELLFELSSRIALFTMQLVLYARISECNILLSQDFDGYREGESAAEAVRVLHLM
jgi:hypothetical protein